MTCIVGVVDKENSCVWMGADSLGSNGFTKATQGQPKVFRNKIFKNVVIGSTSTFRHIDLLKYSKNLFAEVDFYKNTTIDHEYMVTNFIPNIMKLFKEGLQSFDVKERGANFLVGAGDKLFEIQEDYSVLQPEVGFCSVGCGEYAANASLFTTEGMNISIPKRIEIALISAERTCCGVQRPFKIINTKDTNEIVINT